MYYFSRIRMSPDALLTGRAQSIFLNSIYHEHKMVWNFFGEEPNTNRDFLYRRYDLGKLPQYFVLSRRTPYDDQNAWEIQTKEYKPLIHKNKMFSFTLRANPTITKKPEGKDSNKRKREDVYMEALARNKELPPVERKSNNEVLVECGILWLQSRSQRHGFTVNPEHILVEGYQKLTGNKDRSGHRIQIGAIDFSGILKVEDVDLFRTTLETGIGKSRAFGCGLMLIRPGEA